MTADAIPHPDQTDDHSDEYAGEHAGPATETAGEEFAGERAPDGPGEDVSAEETADVSGGEEAGRGTFVPDAGLAGDAPQPAAPVQGRIDIHTEVVEKVAGLAATEVTGVADLGGDVERTVESVRERIGIGRKRGDQGVNARIDGGDVTIDVTIVVEYGHVVMDVARDVQHNVAVQANRMLGLRVVEVNVAVDDVRLPRPDADETEA